MRSTQPLRRTVGGMGAAIHARMGANRVKLPVSVSRSPLLNGKRLQDEFVPRSTNGVRRQTLATSLTRAKDEQFLSRKNKRVLKHAAWYQANYQVMAQLHPEHAKMCALGLRGYLSHDPALRMKFFADLLHQFAGRCEQLFHPPASKPARRNKNMKEKQSSSSSSSDVSSTPADKQLLALFSEAERAHLATFNFRTMLFPDMKLLRRLEDPVASAQMRNSEAFDWVLANRHQATLPHSLSAFTSIDVDARIKRAQRYSNAQEKLKDTPPTPRIPHTPLNNRDMQVTALLRAHREGPRKRSLKGGLPTQVVRELAVEKKLRRKLRLEFYRQPGVVALHSNANNFWLVQRDSRDSPPSFQEARKLWAKAKERGEAEEYKLSYVKPAKELLTFGRGSPRGSKLYHQYRANESLKKVLVRLLQQGSMPESDALVKAHQIVRDKLAEDATAKDFAALSRLQRAAFFFHHPQGFLKHARHLSGFDAYYYQRRLQEGYSTIDGIKGDGSVVTPLAARLAKQAGINKGVLALQEMNKFRRQCKKEWGALSPEEQNGFDERDESVAAQFPLVKSPPST